MPFKSFFDFPDDYTTSTYYLQGGSPKLLKNIIDTVEENLETIEEISLCWYLFNNKVLHNYLKEIAQKGVKVNVITIPLEGYDNKSPQQLTDLETNVLTHIKYTKYGLAKEIFKDFYYNDYPNYNIYFFNHIYVRSRFIKKFSKGNFPYSLHIKNGYIKKKDGYICLLSSSNLAVRDQVKHESLLIIENEPNYEDNTKQFFNDIIRNSIHVKSFNKNLNILNQEIPQLTISKSVMNFYSAPFYYDSAIEMEEKLIGHIKQAKNEIIICGQHLSAFNYKFHTPFHSKPFLHSKSKPGILSAILGMSIKGVKTTYLSQTLSTGNESQGHNFRNPVNKSNYINFYRYIKDAPSTSYYVNENIHSKYIVIDDLLIFCTFNFTPTQFIFLDEVKIDSFKHMPNQSFYGIHCEVSSYAIVKDLPTVNAFRKNFSLIINHPKTKKVL